MDGRLFVVAEIGESPNPFSRLEDLIGAAAACGADAAKIQLFRAEHFPPEEQQTKRKVEFPRDRLGDFVALAHKTGLMAGASVFDLFDIEDALAAEVDFLKLATREERNLELLHGAIASGRTVMRSFDWRAYVKSDIADWPSVRWHLGCIPEYPATADLFQMYRLRDVPEPRGWSSHSPGWLDCLRAVKCGAGVIEKHLCFSLDDPGSDWSLNPREFGHMVRKLRSIHVS